MNCKECGFPVASRDRFCGACGSALAQLDLTLCRSDLSPLGPVVPRTQLASGLLLKVENRGVGAPVELEQSLFVVAPGFVEVEFQIPSDGLGSQEFVTIPIAFPSLPHREWTHLHLGYGELGQTSILVSDLPRLELSYLGTGQTLQLGQGLSFSILLRSREGAGLTGFLEILNEGVACKSVSELVTPQEPVRLEITIGPVLVERLFREQKKVLRLQASYPGHELLSVEIPLTRPPSPCLRGRETEPRLELSVVESFEHEPLCLKLGNGFVGEENLTPWLIEAVAFSSQETGFRAELAETMPVEVQSGATHRLEFHLEAPSYPSFFRIQFFFEDQVWDIPVRLERRQRQVYPGWLVLDLGTRGSCAVGKEVGREPMFLGQNDLIDSSVSYQSLRPLKRYQIGQEARLRLGSPEGRRSGTVAVKRSLLAGESRVTIVPWEEPQQQYELDPGEVLADFTECLIKEIQADFLGRGELALDFRQVLLCHPSRLTDHQRQAFVERIKTVLRSCLAPRHQAALEVLELPESVAAALSFVDSNLKRLKRPATLLVYDLGGTSLDLCLLKLEPGVPARWRVLGVDGVTEVGGELLIDQTMQELIRLVEARTGGQLLLADEVSRSDSYRERAAFRQQVEELVIGFCESKRDRLPFRLPLEGVHYRRGGDLEKVELQELDVTLASLRPVLETTIHAGLKRLERFLERLGCPQPDLVLRAGRGSSFPLVDSALRNRFSRTVYLVPERPKECVALGACYHPRLQQSRGGLILGPEEAGACLWMGQPAPNACLVASIGLRSGGGEGRFQEVLPVGTRVGGDLTRREIPGVMVWGPEARLILLQNFGHDDRLHLDNGLANPEITILAEAEFPPVTEGQPLTLIFELVDSEGLVVTVRANGHSQQVLSVAPERFAVTL